MNIRLTHIIIGCYLLALVSIFSACKKGDKASPSNSSDTQISFALSASGKLSPVGVNANGGLTTNSLAANATAAGITWTSGIANVSAFKLEAKKGGTEIEIKSHNLTSVDLFSLSPTTVSTTIADGTYDEIEVKALFVKSSGSDIPLTLKGSYTSQSGTVTPIEFDFNDDALIKVEAENVTIDGTTDIAAITKLDLTRLIGNTAAAALDAATRTNGTIIISNSSNTNIYNAIKANVELCGKWGGFEHHDKRDR